MDKGCKGGSCALNSGICVSLSVEEWGERQEELGGSGTRQMGSLTPGKLEGQGGTSEMSPVGESNAPYSTCACHACLEGRGGGPGPTVHQLSEGIRSDEGLDPACIRGRHSWKKECWQLP